MINDKERTISIGNYPNTFKKMNNNFAKTIFFDSIGNNLILFNDEYAREDYDVLFQNLPDEKKNKLAEYLCNHKNSAINIYQSCRGDFDADGYFYVKEYFTACSIYTDVDAKDLLKTKKSHKRIFAELINLHKHSILNPDGSVLVCYEKEYKPEDCKDIDFEDLSKQLI